MTCWLQSGRPAADVQSNAQPPFDGGVIGAVAYCCGRTAPAKNKNTGGTVGLYTPLPATLPCTSQVNGQVRGLLPRTCLHESAHLTWCAGMMLRAACPRSFTLVFPTHLPMWYFPPTHPYLVCWSAHFRCGGTECDVNCNACVKVPCGNSAVRHTVRAQAFLFHDMCRSFRSEVLRIRVRTRNTATLAGLLEGCCFMSRLAFVVC